MIYIIHIFELIAIGFMCAVALNIFFILLRFIVFLIEEYFIILALLLWLTLGFMVNVVLKII